MVGRNEPENDDEDIFRNDDNDIEALRDPSEDPPIPQDERDVEDSTDVRNSSNNSKINKMLPSQGLKTKAHGTRSPTNASKEEESKGSGGKKENSSAEKGFVWGPQQTRTSIKKQKNPS